MHFFFLLEVKYFQEQFTLDSPHRSEPLLLPADVFHREVQPVLNVLIIAELKLEREGLKRTLRLISGTSQRNV